MLSKSLIISASTIFVFIVFSIPTQAANPVVTNQCDSIQLNPIKTAYHPGETVTITVKGEGDITNITVRYAPARRDLIQQPPNYSWISTVIDGQYNPDTKTWTGNWVIPTTSGYEYPFGITYPTHHISGNGNGDGEYIIMPNLTRSDGLTCAGNPAYSLSCRNGTISGDPTNPPGTLPCNGCHKTITVDSHYGQTTGYNFKDYWNLKSGNFWLYEGVSTVCGVTPNTFLCTGDKGAFQTLVTAEESINLCGLTLQPLRYVKSKPEAYITPNNERNFRTLISNFQDGSPWSANTIGRPAGIYYDRPVHGPVTSLENLGTWSTNARLYANNNIDFEDIYYAPQFFTKQYVDNGWMFESVDKLYGDTQENFYSCNWDLRAKPDIAERYIHNQVFTDTVQTPVYSGPVLRLSLFEHGYYNGGWHIREDWFFAKDIGRVRIAWKDCRASLQKNPNDPDCDITSPVAMVSPDGYMNLTDYYSGEALQVTATPPEVPNGKWILHVDTAHGHYTGHLEVKSCISETNCSPGTPSEWGYGNDSFIWVQDGDAEVDPLIQGLTGSWHTWFRPWIEKPPDSREVVVSTTNLPWSNETIWKIGKAGDFNHDGKVDFSDYTLLKNNFGNPYTILDYNELVDNFGI